jgi:hypothetical protein
VDLVVLTVVAVEDVVVAVVGIQTLKMIIVHTNPARLPLPV